MSNIEALKKEIIALEKKTISDGSPVLIEHLIMKYDKNKLNIKPKYQRVFRRGKEQKSRFIESLLLGIPLPSIFVAEDEDGRRELVDGLQRISTILEFSQNKKFITNYKKTNNSILLGLESGQYLKNLKGIKWNDLPERYKNKILDTKIYVGNIKNTGDVKSKFELFQRLNTGGTKLSNQEVRNCLLVDKNENVYDDIYDIANDKKFKKLIDNVSIEKIIAEENMELVFRCLALQNIKLDQNIKIGKLIDDFIYNLTGLDNNIFNSKINIKENLDSFIQMVSLLESIDDRVFNKINKENKRKNHFIYPLYDVISSGIAYNIKEGNIDTNKDKQQIKKMINEIQSNKEYKKETGIGKSSQMKLKFASIFGKEYFNIKKIV